MRDLVERRWARAVVVVVAVSVVAGAVVVGLRPDRTPARARQARPAVTAPASTLATVPPPRGSAPSTVELAAGCREAVAPLRALMGRQPSGAVLDEAATGLLNEVLARGPAVCAAEEWARFQERELLPWLRTPPPAAR